MSSRGIQQPGSVTTAFDLVRGELTPSNKYHVWKMNIYLLRNMMMICATTSNGEQAFVS
jgi:hypothetical protein